MPNISSDDEAAWGRVRLITFPKSHLGEEDKSLKQSMVTPRNLQAVLTWMVKGAIDYYALGSAGLSELQSSKDAKGIQSTLLDNVGAWIDEAVAVTGQASDFTSFTDCMKSYQEWCKANAVTPKTANGLARSLEKKRLLLDPNARFEQATMGITRPGGSRSTVRGYKGMLIP
jgi:phage/plasmid-associated DNA primase